MPRQRARVFLSSESETSENSGDENIQPTQATCGSQPTKRKVVVTQYTTAWKFASYAEFDDFWQDESANLINRSSHTSKKTGAYIQYLDCKYRERLDSNCSKKLKIIQKDGLVTVDTSTGEHQCHNEDDDVLTAEVKQKITELMSGCSIQRRASDAKVQRDAMMRTMKTTTDFTTQRQQSSRGPLQRTAVCVDVDRITTEVVVEALEKVLKDPSYRERALKIKEKIASAPFRASEIFVKWTEFAAEHGTLDELNLASAGMNDFVYHSLDVIATLALFVFVVLITAYIVFLAVYRKTVIILLSVRRVSCAVFHVPEAHKKLQ